MMRRYLKAESVMPALVSAMKPTMASDFRQYAASALMHPVTLAALALLLANDLLFKALWPGAWIPGKLSDLAWMVFAPPALAYILSFATLGRLKMQRTAFIAAYVGLPLLYAAFNTFEPVHDAILHALGFFGGDGPRSPLDATDSLVIPFAMIVGLWVWFRSPSNGNDVKNRLALLAAIAAALASIATSYATDRGITNVGRIDSGTIGTFVNAAFSTSPRTYESVDGGLTWTKTSEHYIPLETQDWTKSEVMTPSGDVFIVDSTNRQIVRKWREREEAVYSYEFLQTGGNTWMQALDKRDVQDRVIGTRPFALFYDDQSGNVIAAMGLQGIVVVAPDGTSTRVAVGRYSPTDFSFRNKVGTFFASLLYGEAAISTGLALLLAMSTAALGLVAPAASVWARTCFAVAAVNSALLAITMGIYPHVSTAPWEADRQAIGTLIFALSGFGLIPISLVIAGLVVARTSLMEIPAVAAATVGMLIVILLGGLVLFEAGERTANFVAVGLVGLATVGIGTFKMRKQT